MAIAAIAGLATVGGAMAAAGTFAIGFAAAATAFAIGAGLSVISRALMPKPDFGAMMQGVTGTVREATASRKVIYGKVRVGGAVVFIANSNQNKDLYLVICFACHEIESFEAVYFNDKKVWENGSFLSDWGSYADFGFYDGTQTQADNTLSTASAFWGNTHVLNGIAYMRVKLTWDEDRKKFPQGVPNVSAIIKGKKLYDPRVAVTSAGSLVTGTSYYITSVGTTDFTLVGASENKVGVEFVATGTTTGSGEASAISWSQNPALALRDYLTNDYYGLGAPSGEMDATSWEAAADACDEQVTLDAGGTHDRYHCDGVLDTANSIKSNIEALTACMGGRIAYMGGKYYVQAAEYHTPTITIDETMMVGPITVQTKQSRRQMYNAVKGVFLSEEENYTLCDYPAKVSSTYEAQDGDPIFLDMPLPFVTNNIRAQRLAKIALLKSRQQVVVNVPLNLAALRFKAGDFINISNDRLGFSSKPFEVMGYDLNVNQDGTITVNLQAIETDSAVYDWTASTDEDPFNLPSDPSANDGTTVGAPQAPLNLTEYTLANSDGSTITGLKISWTASDDGFIEYYEVEVTDSADTLSTFFNTTTETEIQIAGLRSYSGTGVTYNVKVRAVNTIGVRSADLTGSIALTGDTSAPTGHGSIVGTPTAKGINFTWTNPTDADFKHMRVFIDDDTSRPSLPTAVMDGEEYFVPVTIPSGQTSATRYCWIQPEDFSGNRGSVVGPVSAIVNLLDWNDLLASNIVTSARDSYNFVDDTTRNIGPSYEGLLKSLTLPAVSDTSLSHKPYLRIFFEWEVTDGANWEDDGGDKPEIEWSVASSFPITGSSTIYSVWYYVHPYINDTSADKNIFQQSVVVAFPERTSALTVYWRDDCTQFDTNSGIKGFYRRWEMEFIGVR